MPVGKGSNSLIDLLLTKEQYKTHCVLWAKLIHSYGSQIQLYIEEPLMGILHKDLPNSWILSGCIAGSAYGAIMANGDVRACIFVPEPLGNLKQKTFAEIWEQSDLRPLFTKKEYTGNCNVCNIKQICGGCRAMSYAKTGKIDDYDSLCFLKLM
jgi:radical SAM protein with 4Fe4S-binding SPASM domain